MTIILHILFAAALLCPSVALAQTSPLADRQAIYNAMSTTTQSGPVTTLSQQEAIWDALLTSAKSDPSSLASNAKSLVPQYGNYCGYQTTASGALPIDCVDGACFQHDTSPGYTLATPTLAQVVQADQQLIANLSFTQASTPYGELYRNLAIQVFEAKTTYEQANQTTLVTSCKDCLSQP